MTTTSQTAPAFNLSLLRCAAGTDVGMRRDENQDSFGIIKHPAFQAFFVADGMGGVHGGAVASRLAISTLEEQLKDPGLISPEGLSGVIQSVNKRIFSRGQSEPALAGMGTTLVGMIFRDDCTVLVNVGDSRAYLVRAGETVQLTEDHTLVNELVKSGAITPEQAENHPVSHMLTRSLGPLDEVQIDAEIVKDGPQPGDSYVLCSDGLYNFVDDEEIGEVVRQNPLDDANQILINLANQRGGADNITVLVISVGDLVGKGRSAAYRHARDARNEVEQKETADRGEASRAVDLCEQVPLTDSGIGNDERSRQDHAKAEQSNSGDVNEAAHSGDLVGAAGDNSLEKTSEIPSKPEKNRSETGEPERADDAGATSEYDPYQTQRSPIVVEPAPQKKQARSLSRLKAAQAAKREAEAKVQEGGSPREKSRRPRLVESGASTRFTNLLRTVPVPLLVVSALVFGLFIGSVAKKSLDSLFVSIDMFGLLNEGDNESTGAANNSTAQLVRRVEELSKSRAGRRGEENAPESLPLSEADVATTIARVQTDRERIAKTREMFQGAIAKIERQLRSFSSGSAPELEETLRVARSQADELQGKLSDTELQIDAASRKLSQWYGRQKRLENNDPLKLAAEVGATSPAVQGKKAAFEQATYEFINKRDELELYPANDQLREVVTQLKDVRSQRLKELQDEVRSTVEGVLTETDKQLEELRYQRDMFNLQLQSVKQDLEVAKSLADQDPERRARMRRLLEQKRLGLLGSLAELDSFSSQQQAPAPVGTGGVGGSSAQ